MILKKIGTGESYDKIVSIVVEVLHTFPAQVEDSSCLFILVPMLSDCGLFERTFPNCYLGFFIKILSENRNQGASNHCAILCLEVRRIQKTMVIIYHIVIIFTCEHRMTLELQHI